MMSLSRNTLLFILICGISYRMISSKTDEDYEILCRQGYADVHCTKSFSCRIFFDDLTRIKMIPDVDTLIKRCNKESIAFGSIKPALSPAQIQHVEIIDQPPLPPNYFCKLTSAITIELYSLNIINSNQLGFKTDCKNQYQNDCCACNVKELRIIESELQVVSNASFCGFSKLETLKMSAGEIAKINSNAFMMLTALQRLDMSSNQLKKLSPSVFQPLASLVNLNLKDNKLNRNVFQALQNMTLLKVLDLSSNNIADVPELGLPPNLETLDLSVNQLKQLSPSIFHPLTSLVNLSLEHNQLNRNVFQALQNMTLLKVLDLSSNNIADLDNDTIGNGLTSLIELNLVENKLTNLSADLSHLRKLEMIDVSWNQIRDIAKGVFDPLQQLRRIDLYRNRLISLSDDLFIKNVHLKWLNLQDNQLTSVPNLMSTSLETLLLDGNKIGNITASDKDHLCQLVNLKYLDLSNNRINAIVAHAFDCNGAQKNQSKLAHIDLSSNELQSFSFVDFSMNLVELKLNYNHIQKLPNNSQIFHRPMSLKALSVKANRLTHVSDVALPPNLKTLDLSGNAIEVFSFARTMSGDRYAIPPHLQLLNLLNNELEVICPFNFLNITLLVESNPLKCACERKHLKVKHSRLNLPCPKALESLNSNSTAHLINERVTIHQFLCDGSQIADNCQCNLRSDYSTICNLPCPESCACYVDRSFSKNLMNCSGRNLHAVQQLAIPVKLLLVLHYSSNYLTTINSSTFASYPMAIEVHMNSNKLREISYDAFHNMTNLQVLNLEENCLKELPLVLFVGIMKLTHLYLGKICLEQISNNIFQNLTNLEVLNLEVNCLEELPTVLFASLTKLNTLNLAKNKLVKIPNNIFQNLTNLQVLNLEDNSLTELPSGLVAGLTKLTELHLARNHLMYISDDIFPSLTVLQTLDLQNNSLTSFSVWKLEKFTNLSNLKLGHNPWSCDCKFVWEFREQLKVGPYLMQDEGDVFCKSEDDTVPPQPILSANFSYCYTPSPGFIHVVGSVTHIWASVVAAFVLLITSLILLFVYRREMQVIIYSRYRLRIFHRNQETDEGKVYDAFLAYSYDDAEFVVHELIPGLEQIERPYKLCIHERDFLAGGPIMYNILEAVEQSRRTIVVLSPNFVKSEWCVFEFKSAHLKMLSDRCSRIIVILLGDIPKHIDPEILVYLKTNTYLKWGDKLFWKRLYFALPDRTVAETTI